MEIGEQINHQYLGRGYCVSIETEKGVFNFDKSKYNGTRFVLNDVNIEWKGVLQKRRIREGNNANALTRTVFKEPSPQVKDRLKEIFKGDVNFCMPLSVAPDQRDAVEDEITGAENGLTVATNRKLHPSHDVVFSKSDEVDFLLQGTGVYTRPFFDRENVVLAHGARKAFFLMLCDLGFEPSRLAAI
jgi:hypothetical protein